MARVYVSSTFNDLKEYREAVRFVVRQFEHEDIAMEYYGAIDERPLDKCLQDVASCDVYIGIFAWRYGFIPDGQEKSITELEYRHATATGKPRLIFLLDEKAFWQMHLVEMEAIEKIKMFRDELMKSHAVTLFSSLDNLKAAVSHAISLWDKERAGFSEIRLVISKYEQHYRQQLAIRYGYVTPPVYASERRQIPLDSLYVMPNFSEPNLKKLPNGNQFINQISRTVLLGHPGSGKSTFACKLSVDLATHYPQHIIGDQTRTPILVIVREYGSEKKRSNCSILDFIIMKANSDYQVKPPEGLFEGAIQEGKAVVVFDGLDELVDTTDRQTITRDIEAFCSAYPNSPVLITSRIVGYEDAPLNKDLFKVYYLAGFEPPQIREYAQKWFADNEKLCLTFLAELEYISADLKSNPLLLALLCSLYQGEGYIPRSKAEIYEKCSEYLFVKRDKDRGIMPNLAFDVQLRSTVRHLAYWIYQNTVLQNGVTERKLIAQATEFLLEKRIEDRDEAEDVAKKFIQFCTGRAWVFTDTGTMKDGERIYQFTHRTFLEYFAAEYLAYKYRTTDDLLTILLPQISLNEGNEVAQLAFQRMSRNSDGIDDELIAALVKSNQYYSLQEMDNILAFALRSLEFITPKSSLVRQLISVCLQRCIDLAVIEIQKVMETDEATLDDIYTGQAFPDRPHLISTFIFALADIAEENRQIIGTTLEEVLILAINREDEYLPLIAAEIGLNLSNIGWKPRGDMQNKKIRRFFDGVSRRIFNACSEHIIKDLCPKYVRVALDVYKIGEISLRDLIRFHGPQVVFQEHRNLIYTFFHEGELAIDLVSDWCNRNTTSQQDAECVEQLRELADALLPIPTPWMTVFDDSSFSYFTHCNKEIVNLDSNALFGVFIGFAYVYERANGHHYSSENFEKFLPEYFQSIITARNNGGIIDDETEQQVNIELEKCGFSQAQKDFVKKWVNDSLGIIAGWMA